MRMQGTVCFLALTSWMLASGQQTSSPKPQTFELRNLSTRPVKVPAFLSTSNQCDSEGNVFFDVTGPRYSIQVVLRISQGGKDATPFPLPTDLGTKGEWHYSVDGAGGLYILHSEAETHVLIHSSASGATVSRSRLRLPRYFHTHSFAVLPNQATMVVGSVPVSETDAETKEKPLSVWLDPSGSAVQKVQKGLEFSPSENMDDLVIAGGTDTFIEAANAEIRVFGVQGELLKTIAIVEPTPDSFATNLQLSDGTIAVAFSHVVDAAAADATSAPRYLETIWLLADASNGLIKASYRMPKDFVGSTLCYLGDSKFLNFTVQDGQHVFVEASR